MWGKTPSSGSTPGAPKPGTIRQVRGATYPPLTAPPGRQPSAGGLLASLSSRGGSSSSVDVSDGSPAAARPDASAASPGHRRTPSGNAAEAEKNAAAAAADAMAAMRIDQATISKPMPLEVQRLRKFEALLAAEVVDLKTLRSTAWSGVPHQCRAMAWQLLLGYLPPNRAWRESTLERKRREYASSVPQYFDVSDAERTEAHRAMLHQILIDVPRTAPAAKVFRHEIVQRALERVLYIWALRHPASGYVQGINDLVTPFYFVFLSQHLPRDRPCTEEDVEALSQQELMQVEADAYWCLSRLIDSIQDHYTDAQPGIQRMVYKLSHLVKRIDAPLHAHLEEQGLQFIQFAFRWMNCFLMRELSLDLTLRVWDTYLAEHGASDNPSASDGFAVLHVYVCAALLSRYSAELQRMEFQELVMFLQHLPTTGWSDKEVGELLSLAYVYKSLYSQAHLSGTS